MKPNTGYSGPNDATADSKTRVRPPLGAVLLSKETWAEAGRSLGLTERELQIVREVFDNGTEGAIAASLGLSSHTVHTHLNRLFRKLAVRTRAELVQRVMAEAMGLTAAPESRHRPQAGTGSRPAAR